MPHHVKSHPGLDDRRWQDRGRVVGPHFPAGGDYSWWKEDEGAGVVANDSGPLANNGDIFGGAGFWGDFSPDGATPVGHYTVHDIIGLADPDVNNGDHLVIAAAVMPDAAADQMIICKAHPANGYNYELYFWDGGGGRMDVVFYYLSAGPTNHIWGGFDLPCIPNLWYIVIFYYKMGTGATAKMWLNGVLRTTTSWVAGNGNAPPLLAGVQHLHLGSYDGIGDDSGFAWPWGGWMGDIILWPNFGREFTEVDAQDLYNVLRGRYFL